MVHKPKHKVHSFRGLLGDGGQEEINLERQNVNLAFRIVKFDVMVAQPFAVTSDSVIKIYRESVTTVDTTLDFSDQDLLGAAILNNSTSSSFDRNGAVVIFDNTLFSRNIYVTVSTHTSDESVNYYIELEEVPVTAATLMQLKLGTARKLIGAKMGA